MSNVILVQSILGIFLFFVLELNLNFVHRSFLGCVIYLLFVVGRVGLRIMQCIIQSWPTESLVCD